MIQDCKKLFLTGASGFVGQRFLSYNKEKYNIKTASLQSRKVIDLNLSEFDVVVHLAGKAHQMEKIEDQIYFDVNYELTKALADKAKIQKVSHFIFISTIKVYGDNYKNAHLTLDKKCIPDDAYGASKKQAEDYIRSIETKTFKVSIIRPPLIYGSGVKGNMIRLIKLANQPLPLPFGGINNKRSMVFIDNLIALINSIIDKEVAGIFLAGDKKPISTSRLLEIMQKKLKKKSNLFKLPDFFIKLLFQIKPTLMKRLFNSLTVDTSQTNKQLNFSPPFSSEYGIEQMIEWFKNRKQ